MEAASGWVVRLIPGAGLPVVGLRRKKDLAFLRDTMDGREAERCGFATCSVSARRLAATGDRMADANARMPLEIFTMKKLAIDRGARRIGSSNIMEIRFVMSRVGRFGNSRRTSGARLEIDGFKSVMAPRKADTRHERNRN